MVRKAVSGFVLFSLVVAVAGISFSLFMQPLSNGTQLFNLFNSFQGIMKAGTLLTLPIGVWFLYKGVSNAV